MLNRGLGLMGKDEHRTLNVQRPMMNERQKQGQELIKIFVASIKTAEKKKK
jgi:hypothetical protein